MGEDSAALAFLDFTLDEVGFFGFDEGAPFLGALGLGALGSFGAGLEGSFVFLAAGWLSGRSSADLRFCFKL
jgi:hypothetical protein